MTRFILRGLKAARFGFTEMIDRARAGEEVIIIEKGHARNNPNGYRLVKLTEAELQQVINNDPVSSMPKPGGVPAPGSIPPPSVVK